MPKTSPAKKAYMKKYRQKNKAKLAKKSKLYRKDVKSGKRKPRKRKKKS